MTGILKSIFRPNDGTREKVKGEVVASRESVDKAVNRFEETIRDLMDRNDKLTGRANPSRRGRAAGRDHYLDSRDSGGTILQLKA